MRYDLFDELKESDVLDYPVDALECKHVILNEPKEIYEASVKANYDYVILGSHRHASINDENERIFNMVSNKFFNRPVRIVKAKDGRLWCDNTHTAMAYLRRNYKKDIRLKNIPFYLVDVSCNVPVVISINNSVIQKDDDIQNAINCSLQINSRLDKGVRPKSMSYTVGELNKIMLGYTCLIFKKWYAEILNKPSYLLSELNVSI
ncbi:hypothetical protein [Lacrimispora amygdalina]|uniref:hypothetical protein n=1 Tax=Lacrimispora amygdalina TaxID=253257 RepID=UPI000BE27370|nr:hypothetical protein [Lacrimispora amygdalina]